MIFPLLVLFSIRWINVSSTPINDEGFGSFSHNNLLNEKQSRKDFREFDGNNDGLLIKPHYCVKRAECIPLNYSTCFGVKIPYAKTSLSLVPGITSQEEAQERLHKWHNSLIHIPKCWAVVQPFLCALFMPKCEENQVVLPSKEMCDVIQHPCRILNIDNQWPVEFNCTPYKQEKCKNDLRDLKFNTTSRCMPPLVPAELDTSYYEGIEGCGVQCHDPFFSDDERQEIRTIVIGGSILACLGNLFAVLTFIIDRKSTKKYPSTVALFFINFSFFLVSCGYIYQFRPGANDHTICHKDGTLRTSEPNFREDVSCVASFVFVYYFLIAGIVWFVIFAYAWLLSLKGMEKGKIKGRKDKRKPYYHLVAWSLPLVLTTTVMALQEVDGDSLLGICFVGGVNKQFRLIFLLGPLSFSVVGLILFMKGVYTLICLKITSKEHITSKGNARICESIARVIIFSTLIGLFGTTTFIYHIYEYQHYDDWKKSFRKFIICQLDISGDAERCRMQHPPSVLMVQLQLIALFGTHLAMASWVCKGSTINTWLKCINRLRNKETEELVTFRRHKLIARAYAKRDLLKRDDGRLSISISNSRQDPVGLNFELNSMASNNLSSTWARALPKLITRRGALTALSGSNSSQRRNSMDSEISYSVRRVSVESRRHSLDSTVSVKALEVTKTVRKRPRTKKFRRKEKNYKHKSIKRKISSSRRASNASQASDLETEVMTALKITNFNDQNYGPNLKRRQAIPDIEMSNLKLLDIGQKLLNYSDDNDSSNNSGEVESESEA